MSEKKEVFEATKATDKRHFRKPAKIRHASGKGKSITGNGKPLMHHFAKGTEKP